MKISEQESRAYKAIRDDGWGGTLVVLADALQKAVARAKELEFNAEHKVEQIMRNPHEHIAYCSGCPDLLNLDPRHLAKPDDWLRLADEILRGGK